MVTYSERVRRWDAAVAGISIPDPETGQLSISVLEAQLERAVDVVRAADDKAALVIPAIGIVAGLIGSPRAIDPASEPLLTGVGIGAAVCGIAAALFAVLTLLPRERSIGPDPKRVVLGSDEAVANARVNYVQSLGFAVQSTQDLALVKTNYLSWAFRVAAAGITLVILFVALGGVR
jgi:hypothetical protein